MYEIIANMTNDEDFDLSFVVTGEDDTELPIAALDFEFVISDTDDNQLLSRTSLAGDITKDTVTSTVAIVIDNSYFAGFDQGQYKMACRYTDTSTGRTKQLFVGDLLIDEGQF